MSAVHILVVEDEDIIGDVIRLILEESGFKVTVARDAASAWLALQEGYPIELVLLDRGLPDADGLTLLRRIKDNAELRHLPVVVQTALSGSDSVREGLAAGAYYYLAKPLDPRVLLAVVNAALRERRESALTHETLAGTIQALQFLQQATFRFHTITEGRTLAQSLACACPDPGRTVLGLQELLINAVEHGNYGLSYADKSRLLAQDQLHQEHDRLAKDPAFSRRQVTVQLSRSLDQLCLTIQDEGDGFDWKDYLDFSPERAFDLHGRGIAMARLTSFDSMEYLGNGNTVTVGINLPKDSSRPNERGPTSVL